VPTTNPCQHRSWWLPLHLHTHTHTPALRFIKMREQRKPSVPALCITNTCVLVCIRMQGIIMHSSAARIAAESLRSLFLCHTHTPNRSRSLAFLSQSHSLTHTLSFSLQNALSHLDTRRGCSKERAPRPRSATTSFYLTHALLLYSGRSGEAPPRRTTAADGQQRAT
jgi:hypothetical protein